MKNIEKVPTDEICEALTQQHAEALKLCDYLITHFEKKAHESKRIFQLLKYSSVFLAVAVTVLSALSAVEEIGPWVISVVSGLTALCTALLGATNAQELWVRSRDIQRQLTVERFLYLQSAGRYSKSKEEAKARRFSERIVEVWSGGHEAWEQVVTEVSSQ